MEPWRLNSTVLVEDLRFGVLDVADETACPGRSESQGVDHIEYHPGPIPSSPCLEELPVLSNFDQARYRCPAATGVAVPTTKESPCAIAT